MENRKPLTESEIQQGWTKIVKDIQRENQAVIDLIAEIEADNIKNENHTRAGEFNSLRPSQDIP